MVSGILDSAGLLSSQCHCEALRSNLAGITGLLPRRLLAMTAHSGELNSPVLDSGSLLVGQFWSGLYMRDFLNGNAHFRTRDLDRVRCRQVRMFQKLTTEQLAAQKVLVRLDGGFHLL
jgi:hypothetical protein